MRDHGQFLEPVSKQRGECSPAPLIMLASVGSPMLGTSRQLFWLCSHSGHSVTKGVALFPFSAYRIGHGPEEERSRPRRAGKVRREEEGSEGARYARPGATDPSEHTMRDGRNQCAIA